MSKGNALPVHQQSDVFRTWDGYTLRRRDKWTGNDTETVWTGDGLEFRDVAGCPFYRDGKPVDGEFLTDAEDGS